MAGGEMGMTNARLDQLRRLAGFAALGFCVLLLGVLGVLLSLI